MRMQTTCFSPPRTAAQCTLSISTCLDAHVPFPSKGRLHLCELGDLHLHRSLLRAGAYRLVDCFCVHTLQH